MSYSQVLAADVESFRDRRRRLAIISWYRDYAVASLFFWK